MHALKRRHPRIEHKSNTFVDFLKRRSGCVFQTERHFVRIRTTIRLPSSLRPNWDARKKGARSSNPEKNIRLHSFHQQTIEDFPVLAPLIRVPPLLESRPVQHRSEVGSISISERCCNRYRYPLRSVCLVPQRHNTYTPNNLRFRSQQKTRSHTQQPPPPVKIGKHPAPTPTRQMT